MKKYILIIIFVFIAIKALGGDQPKLFGGEWEEVNVHICFYEDAWWTLECETKDYMLEKVDRKIVIESNEKHKVIPLNDLIIPIERPVGFILYLTSDTSPFDMWIELKYDHGKRRHAITSSQVFNPDGVNAILLDYVGDF